MFESIRKNTRIMALLLGIVVVPAFVLVGVNGYTQYSERSEPVAEVGTATITRDQWEQAHQAEIQRIQRSAPNVDLKLLDSAPARYATLERLVQDLVLTTARDDKLLTVSDAQLAQALIQQPVIASLRGPDGQLDAQKYSDLLAAQGFTPASYEAGLRASLSTDLVTQVVTNTTITHPNVERPILQAFFERRTVSVKNFAPADFKAAQVVSDADVKAYYDKHPERFQAPEVVDVEYVVLDQSQIAASIKIDDAELKNYYEQNKQQFVAPERRRVRHILIEAGTGDAEQSAAKTRASALLEQIKAKPGLFAELAKKNSQDPGSAAQGGDLGWVERGAMVKPFEDAAFALKKDQVSDLVQTEFGWHILQVTGIESSQAKSFEAMRAELLADVQKSKARVRYAELAEKFSNMVYEQATSFEAVAQSMGLDVRRQSALTRAGAKGVLADPKVLRAIFDPDSLRGQRNIDAVEVNNAQMVSARVTRYEPAHTRPLADVAQQAKAMLIEERAAEAAWKAGDAELKRARSGEPIQALRKPTVVSRDAPGQLPAAVVRAVMALKADALPAWTGVNLGPDGYALIKLEKVEGRAKVDATQVASESRQLTQAYANAETQAYVEHLRQTLKTKILVPRPSMSETN
jgi:peptidyl-prolyl cis-trans isomerase D